MRGIFRSVSTPSNGASSKHANASAPSPACTTSWPKLRSDISSTRRILASSSTANGREVQRIDQQIQKHLDELLAVAGQHRLRRAQCALQPHLFFFRLAREQIERVIDDLVEVVRTKVRRPRARRLQQQGDETIQAIGLADDEAGEFAAFFVEMGLPCQQLR